MTVDEIYKLLGNMLHASIKTEYKEAYLEIERIPASVEFGGYYIDSNNARQPIRGLLVNKETSNAVHELHEITTEGGNNKWNRLLLKLHPSGQFGMDFINDEELEEQLEFFKAGGKPQEWLAKKPKQ